MQTAILRKFPKADISVSLVWIQMPGFNDNRRSATKIARLLDDPRVAQFYDPVGTHLAGNAFAKGIVQGGRGPAWDIYFFYKPGAVWEDGPPKPDAYMHQLGGIGAADPKFLRTGKDLINGLEDTLREFLGATVAQSTP